MIGSVFTVVPHAEELELTEESMASSEEQQDESVEEYIYYSDLFYEYPYYLTENGFFNAYNSDVEYIFNEVFNEYKNSPYVVRTGLEHAMDMFGSPTDIAKFAASFLGISNYESNKAIDSANKKLMMELLSGSDKDNLLKTYGKIGTTVTKVKKAFNVLDTIYSYDPGNPLEGDPEGTAKEQLEYYTQYYLREAYAELYNLGVLKKFNNTFISRFYTAFTDEGIRISDYFSPSVKAIDIAKSVLELIMIEDTKMELIDDIIATQSSNTLLKTGMTRLKNQLVGGSVTYFMDTYIKTKAADAICGFIDELYLDVIPSYRAISKAVKQIRNIVFSIWEVPKYDDVMTYKVLEAYSNDLYRSILTKASVFRDGPFISDRIEEYEALFNAYIATNKLAINSLQRIADMMQPYGDVYALFEEAQQKGVANVVIEWTNSVNNQKNTLTFDAYTSEDALIQSLQTLVFSGNEFTVKNGIQTVKFSGKSICCYLAVKEGVETIQTPLQNYADQYNNVDIYSEYTQQLKDYIGGIPVSARIKIEKSTYENWSYSLTNEIQLGLQTDAVEKNYIYAVNGYIRGNVQIISDCNYVLPNDLIIAIDGNFSIAQSRYIAQIVTVSDGASLEILGNLNGSNAMFPRLVSVEKQVPTTTINNYGSLIVHGNCTTISYNDRIDSNAYINENLNLNGSKINVQGSFFVNNHVDVANYSSIVNNGFTKVGSIYLQSMNYNAGLHSITNNGYFEITGNFESSPDTYANSRTGYRIIQSTSNAIFVIGGDFLANTGDVCDTITNGTVIFNGNNKQNVKNLKAYSVTIENSNGINYLTNISIYGLFDPKFNPIYFNNYVTIVNNTTKFIDGYDYKTIRLQSNINLEQSVKAKIISNGYNITVNNGQKAKIDGDVNLNKSKLTINGELVITGHIDISNYSSIVNNEFTKVGSVYLQSMNYNAGLHSITNNGYFEITGNFESSPDTYANSRTGYRIIQNASNAVFVVGGDFRANTWDVCDTITNGQMIFNGNYQQLARNLKAPTIILENKSETGVVFTTSISPSVLFNHNGNKFTLYNNGSGSTFVDYDGDGLKDNVDPYPTVGNSCVIAVNTENTGYGTVSHDNIETVGGTVVTITAEPTFKYEFVGWQNAAGKTVSTAAEYTFVAKTNDTLTAIFRKRLQPIVKQTVVGGIVNAPSSAEIESSVFVTVTENEGYIFTEGSLKINGETIAPGSFVMPDVPVTITAEFVRNENYFALKDAIAAARKIPSIGYTNASVEQLQDAIALAQASIRNHISEAESNALISAIDEAEQALESSCKAQIAMKTDSINIIFSAEGYLYGDSDISPIPGMIMDDVGGIWGISYSINGEEVQVTNYSIESKTCTMLLEGIPYSKINLPITVYMYGIDDDWDFWDFEYTLSSPLQLGAEIFDANGDGDIDIRDLIRMKKLASGMPQTPDNKLPDLDGNGELNALDLSYLRKILLLV